MTRKAWSYLEGGNKEDHAEEKFTSRFLVKNRKGWEGMYIYIYQFTRPLIYNRQP